MKYTASIGFALVLSACGGNSGSSDTESVYIYDTDLIRGCDFPDNETLAQSAATLTNAGIEVTSSSCGNIIGVAWQEACSSPTGQINLHLILRESVDDATPLGYESTDAIGDFTTTEGIVFDRNLLGYLLADCEDS